MRNLKSFLSIIKHFFRHEDDFSPEESTLYVGLISLLIIGTFTDISAMTFLTSKIIVIKLLIIQVIFFLLFIGLKQKKNIAFLQLLTVVTCVLGLGSFWFDTKGILGAVCFYFLVIIVIGNTLLPTKYHFKSLFFYLFIISVLASVEFLYPQTLLNPYANEKNEKLFAFILLLMGTILCGTITSYFKNSYEKNHAEMAKKNEELHKINRDLDNLIYSISHDLRAPIVSLMGLVSLHKEIAVEEEAKKYIELEERSLDKLDKFIQDLLAYSRVNRTEAEYEEIDLEGLLVDIIQQLSFYHQSKQNNSKKQVKMNLSFNAKKPVFADKTKLHIVLQNLISNALNYADFSKEIPYCNVNVKQLDNETIIEISDNGVGIDAKHGNKIFDMFYRGNTSSKGSGLGLYIVKEAVEKMKGKITFESEVKQGTTFRLILPL